MVLPERLNHVVQQCIADLIEALGGLTSEQQVLHVVEGEMSIGQMAILCLQVLDTRTCYCQAGERVITWDAPPSEDDSEAWPTIDEIIAIAERIGDINTAHLTNLPAIDLLKPSLYAPSQEVASLEAYLYALDYVSAQLRRIWYYRGLLGLEPLPSRIPEINTCAPASHEKAQLEETPLMVATVHYDALCAGNKELWSATLLPRYRQQPSVSGKMAHLWWETGREHAEDLGTHYEYDHTDHETERECKLYFRRFNTDDSQKVVSVSITLQMTDEGWRVDTVTY